MTFSYANPTFGPSAGGIGWFNFGNFTMNLGDTLTGVTGTPNNGNRHRYITYTTPEGYFCRDNKLLDQALRRKRMEEYFAMGARKHLDNCTAWRVSVAVPIRRTHFHKKQKAVNALTALHMLLNRPLSAQ